LGTAVPAGPVLMTGDPTRLEQVLANLLENAVKYTDAGGEVFLSVGGEGGRGRRAGRAGDRAGPGEAVGRAARWDDRGQERGAGHRQRVRRPTPPQRG